MRKGRFFRRRFRSDNAHLHLSNSHLWPDRESIDRLRNHGRELRHTLETAAREHPVAAVLATGALTGLLLWALLRRPGYHGTEALERLEQW